MIFKTDIAGILLTLQFVCAVAAIVTPARIGRWLWRFTLPISVFVIGSRWLEVGYPPLRNLYEAYLWVPFLLALATEVSRLRGINTVRIDAVIGTVVNFSLAFLLSAKVKMLPAALQSAYFVPHVLGYMVAYSLLARAFMLECTAVWLRRSDDADCLARAEIFARDSHSNVNWGFLLLSISLALGSLWGNTVWCAYWQWDPKEQWSLVTWLVYVALFYVRNRPRWRLTLLGLGVIAIFLTTTWINLAKLFAFGLHSYGG